MTTLQRRVGAEIFRQRFPEARSLWTARLEHVHSPMRIEAFALGRSIVIVQDYGDGHGWNAYTPTTDDGRVDVTLDAIAARCGVTTP